MDWGQHEVVFSLSLLKYSPAVFFSDAIMLGGGGGGGGDTWNFSKTHPNNPSKAPLKAKSDIPDAAGL